jgi:hypothetical protein
MFKSGDRVMRINKPQPRGVEIGTRGTITRVMPGSGCEVLWDNNVLTGSFLRNLHPVVHNNKEAKSFLDKEW